MASKQPRQHAADGTLAAALWPHQHEHLLLRRVAGQQVSEHLLQAFDRLGVAEPKLSEEGEPARRRWRLWVEDKRHGVVHIKAGGVLVQRARWPMYEAVVTRYQFVRRSMGHAEPGGRRRERWDDGHRAQGVEQIGGFPYRRCKRSLHRVFAALVGVPAALEPTIKMRTEDRFFYRRPAFSIPAIKLTTLMYEQDVLRMLKLIGEKSPDVRHWLAGW
jgi:hypothetical protein